MSEQSLNDILGVLKKTESKMAVYLPSTKTEMEFTPLTLAQQKNIIDKITSSSFGIIDFYNSIFETIKQSAKGDISNINTIDRINIILAFRKSINPLFEGFDVAKLLERNRTLNLPELKKTVVSEKFTFELSVPNIATDYKFNNFIITNFKDEKMLLGKLLVNELCKFINKITVNENSQVIDFSNQTIKNKYTILEAIDSTQLRNVFDYVSTIRDAEVEMVKLDDKQLEIGPELFIM